jgi:hypothetical protein
MFLKFNDKKDILLVTGQFFLRHYTWIRILKKEKLKQLVENVIF